MVAVGAGIVEQGSGLFIPSQSCLEVCSGSAESGSPFGMSGDSANCRMQFFLMAHQIDPLHQGGLTPSQKKRKASPLQSWRGGLGGEAGRLSQKSARK